MWYRSRVGLVLATAVMVVGITAIDGRRLAAVFPYGQWIATACTLAWYAYLYTLAPPRLRRLMLIGLYAGATGEALFCLAIGMYEYRLANVPLYVPPGHAILYACIFLLVREPWVRRHAVPLQRAMYAVAAAYSVLWLLAFHDRYGFVCFAVFSALIGLVPRSRTFFLAMFLLVAWLELWGTYFGTWYWHPMLLNRFPLLPSGNPPSGIPVFYIGFDLCCLAYYYLLCRTTYRRLAARRSRGSRSLHSWLEPRGEAAA